uniref:NADH dehydrogenase subunit 6 n=1 Tax=Enchiridium sp. MTA_2015 TaxID=1712692 RepID=A0A0P0BR52_9PLAT|nr:NADH dehydrogenase subunit 6 [Enchiridium sp. MTA_2015]ALI86926.1 NADH dehydrogenase subunit 6 [Enchiridium sp. MTA_2015]
MGSFGWCLILVINYLTIYSSNSLKLGGLILGLSFSISIMISLSFLSWLSLIFFIIYIGGLLVLFFYLSSLNYNPLFFLVAKSNLNAFLVKVNFLILLMFSFIYYSFSHNIRLFCDNNFNNYSYNLFNEEEFIMLIVVGVMLLLVLWLVTKLTFNTRGALRPTF